MDARLSQVPRSCAGDPCSCWNEFGSDCDAVLTEVQDLYRLEMNQYDCEIFSTNQVFLTYSSRTRTLRVHAPQVSRMLADSRFETLHDRQSFSETMDLQRRALSDAARGSRPVPVFEIETRMRARKGTQRMYSGENISRKSRNIHHTSPFKESVLFK